ncbi:MAG: hypothetical protein SNJ69_03200 [Chloroflexaceae bacterium]
MSLSSRRNSAASATSIAIPTTCTMEAAALTNRAERAAIYAVLQRQIVDDLPYFWLVDSAGYRAYRATFDGFRVSAGPFLEEAPPDHG